MELPECSHLDTLRRFAAKMRADQREQHVGIEGLAQVTADGSASRQPARGNLVVRCDKNDRRRIALCLEPILQVEAAQFPEMNVEHQTPRRTARRS